MGTHTPGPWLVSDFDWTTVYAKISDDQPGVASTAGEPIAILPVEQQRANARLIAAAPELLAALRATQDALLAYDGHATDPTNAAGWSDSEAFAAYMQASAAIAQATGARA